MDTQFKKGVLEMCVLAMLGRKDCYGYELVDELSKKISISEGTIYPLLNRLIKGKYVKTYLKESNLGPARKYYKLTLSGKMMSKKLKNGWFIFSKRVDGILNSKKN
jgi:PadR family transcriptional regulator, regulatory protein PadR